MFLDMSVVGCGKNGKWFISKMREREILSEVILSFLKRYGKLIKFLHHNHTLEYKYISRKIGLDSSTLNVHCYVF